MFTSSKEIKYKQSYPHSTTSSRKFLHKIQVTQFELVVAILRYKVFCYDTILISVGVMKLPILLNRLLKKLKMHGKGA